ncbi:MAG: aminoglycoside phosphotransferase family protein [Pyrinomonadaceae bacterium]
MEMVPENLPDKFTHTIIEMHTAEGAKWLTDLPQLIEEIQENWSLKVAKPFPNLSYHFVAPCILENGSAAVLKIGFPQENSPIFNEAEMLKIFNGNGAAKMLRIDKTRYALLIEKLTPGAHLKTVFRGNDAKAVEIAIQVLLKIWREPTPGHNFIPLENWFKVFDAAENTMFPSHAIRKARDFYNELKGGQKFLLHGDFHHENILSAQREPFLVIDPKGIIGEIGYEISVFLNNHVLWLSSAPDVRKKLNDAVSKFAEAFTVEPQILRKWAFAQAVLSAWWTFEDNGKNWETDLELAKFWDR